MRAVIDCDKGRYFCGRELIASENFTSRPVMEALGSCLTNKYYEGLRSGRYYAGNESINQSERSCQFRALAAFNVEKTVWLVNGHPLSGSPSNFAVYSALLQRHDRMMGLTLPDFGRSLVMSNRSFWGCGGPRSYLSDPPHGRTRRKRSAVFTARAERPDGAGTSPDSVDISVFRFTLGIPGFDDSNLPRVLGVLFGGLLIVNHFFSLNSLTAAQLRSEGVGLVLAALSISLPLIGRQLNGANKVEKKLEPGQKQIFRLADGLTDSQRQDLAWASYNLLRNTSTTAMLVWHSGQVVGARGFWGALPDAPDISMPLGSLQQRLEANIEAFSNLKEPLYLPGNADLQQWDIIPRGTASVLVQPFGESSSLETEETERSVIGFLLLISNTPAGYRRKDRQWTASLAKKLSEVLSE